MQNQNEAMGTGAALGTPPPPTVPGITTIAFVPPAAQTPQGSSVTMGFTARKGDGSPFTGTVRWGSGAPGSLPSFGSTTSTTSSGNGSVTVTVTSSTPVVEITAYADDANSGTQDPTEVMGAAAVVGTDVDTDTPPSGTALAFVPPVVQAVQGAPVSLPFTAKNHDGSPFVGTVRWGAGAAGSSPSFGETVTTNSSGGGRITVADPDLATQVVAYADRPGSSFGAQGTTEATAAAAVVGIRMVSPTVPSGTDVVFSTPVVRGQTGSSITVPFTARNFDGSPFVGTVRWSAGAAGSAPSYDSVTTTDTIGSGWVTVTPTAAAPALHIAAYADRPGPGAGGQDTSEATGSAAALGDSAPAAPPPGTVVVFTTPVWTVPTGSWPCMAFIARRTNGTVFNGTVRYSLATAGSKPSFTLTTTTDGSGNGCISVEATTVPKQIVAFADRSDIGTFGGPPEPTEISGATVVTGVHA